MGWGGRGGRGRGTGRPLLGSWHTLGFAHVARGCRELSASRGRAPSAARLGAPGSGAALRKPGCCCPWGDPEGQQSLGTPRAQQPRPLGGSSLSTSAGLSVGELKEPKDLQTVLVPQAPRPCPQRARPSPTPGLGGASSPAPGPCLPYPGLPRRRRPAGSILLSIIHGR